MVGGSRRPGGWDWHWWPATIRDEMLMVPTTEAPEENAMESSSRDLTTNELIEAGYDPIEAEKLDALRERAHRFGGRVRVQRRGVALGKQRYTFVVDLHPQGPLRLQSSEEHQRAHGNFADAEQHVIALESGTGPSDRPPPWRRPATPASRSAGARRVRFDARLIPARLSTLPPSRRNPRSTRGFPE